MCPMPRYNWARYQTKYAIRNQINKESPKDENKITKNDVILSGLKKGLVNLSADDLPKRNKRADTY